MASSKQTSARWAAGLGRFAAASLVVAWGLTALPAHAEEEVVTVGEVTIVGRVQKPIASVDVSRLQPKMTLATLRQPFLHRIEKALLKEPF